MWDEQRKINVVGLDPEWAPTAPFTGQSCPLGTTAEWWAGGGGGGRWRQTAGRAGSDLRVCTKREPPGAGQLQIRNAPPTATAGCTEVNGQQ